MQKTAGNADGLVVYIFMIIQRLNEIRFSVILSRYDLS